MAFSEFSGYIPRCQHIKTNGIQCGCPALHRKRFCYFHNRWRAASINLKRAARSAGMLELPVLEDANSIQVALMQVMRLILTRQLDHKTAGLILYALQTASTNLRQVDFDPRHKTDVVIDPRSVAETSVGEDAWAVKTSRKRKKQRTLTQQPAWRGRPRPRRKPSHVVRESRLCCSRVERQHPRPQLASRQRPPIQRLLQFSPTRRSCGAYRTRCEARSAATCAI